MNELDTNVPFERKWFRLGIVLAMLYATFTVLLLWLLTIDVMMAMIVGVVLGTISAIALMVFVLYIY